MPENVSGTGTAMPPPPPPPQPIIVTIPEVTKTIAEHDPVQTALLEEAETLFAERNETPEPEETLRTEAESITAETEAADEEDEDDEDAVRVLGICPVCGFQVRHGAGFCHNCGSEFDPATVQTVPVVPKAPKRFRLKLKADEKWVFAVLAVLAFAALCLLSNH